MHEMSLAMAAIDLAAEQATQRGFTKVTALWLEVGSFSCVDPDTIAFCFEAAARAPPSKGPAALSAPSGRGLVLRLQPDGHPHRARAGLPRVWRIQITSRAREQPAHHRHRGKLICVAYADAARRGSPAMSTIMSIITNMNMVMSTTIMTTSRAPRTLIIHHHYHHQEMSITTTTGCGPPEPRGA